MKYLVALLLALLVPTAAIAKGECKQDRQKFCKDVVEAKGDTGACLNQHMADLSEACKTMLEAKPKKKNAEGSDAHQNPTNSNEPPPLAHAQPQPVCFDESCKEK